MELPTNIISWDFFGPIATTMSSIGGLLFWVIVISIPSIIILYFVAESRAYFMTAQIWSTRAGRDVIIYDKIKRVNNKKTGDDYYWLKKLKVPIPKSKFDSIYDVSGYGNLVLMQQISADEFAPITKTGQTIQANIDPYIKKFLVERYSYHAKRFALNDILLQYQGVIQTAVIVIILMVNSIFMGSAIDKTNQNAAIVAADTNQKIILMDRETQLIDKIDYLLNISERVNNYNQSSIRVISR